MAWALCQDFPSFYKHIKITLNLFCKSVYLYHCDTAASSCNYILILSVLLNVSISSCLKQPLQVHILQVPTYKPQKSINQMFTYTPNFLYCYRTQDQNTIKWCILFSLQLPICYTYLFPWLLGYNKLLTVSHIKSIICNFLSFNPNLLLITSVLEIRIFPL